MDQRQHGPHHHPLLRGDAAGARVLQLSPGDVVAARFVIGEPLGDGRYGTVYRARQRTLDRDVALRVLPAGHPGHEALLRSATAQGTLEHPTVVHVLECREADEGLVVATALLTGGTLADLPRGSRAARAALRDAATALDLAHARGIVHGDLHPAQVRLTADGRACVDGFAGPGDDSAADRRAFAALVADRLGVAPPAATAPASAAALLDTALEALPRRRERRIIAVALVVAAAVIAAGVAVRGGDPDHRARVPQTAAGMTVLGSALTGDGTVTRGCGTDPTTGALCTIAQHTAPGHALAAPHDGTITAWTARGASGPLRLTVIRRVSHRRWLVVARGSFVLAQADRPVRYRVRLPIHRGERVGLEVNSDARIGLRALRGATTDRWLDRLGGSPRRATYGPGSGADGELQLRVEVSHAPPPEAKLITGPRAAQLPAGRTLGRFVDQVPTGQTREGRLVQVGGGLQLDLFAGSRRLARLGIPDALLDGALLSFDHPGRPGALQVRWLNPGAGLPLEHGYLMRAATIIQTD